MMTHLVNRLSATVATPVAGDKARLARALDLAGNLLTYPRSAGIAKRHAREFAKITNNVELTAFAEELQTLDDGSLDERYANTFEIGAQACLYAGFHIFGLAYKRGVLLCSLKAALEEAGVDTSSGELSDHISLVLKLAAHYLAEGDAEGRGEALIEECVLPVTGKLSESFGAESDGYARLVRGLDQWLLTHWTPVVWQLVEEENDAHFLA